MRKNCIDNYEKFALLGNNIDEILFVKYLLESQNVDAFYSDNFNISLSENDKIIKN